MHQHMGRYPVWLSGLMLSAALLMIAGLLALIMGRGLSAFWPAPLWHLTLKDGTSRLGLIHAVELIPQPVGPGGPQQRTCVRVGNRDLSGDDFIWVDDDRVASRTRPADAVVVERMEWGPFYGFLKAVKLPGGVVEEGSAKAWGALARALPQAHRRYQAIQRLQRGTIGDISAAMERHRLAIRRLELRSRLTTPAGAAQAHIHEAAVAELQQRYAQAADRLRRQWEDDAAFRVVLADINGRTKELPVSAVVRIYQPNRLSWLGRAGVYADRLWEFVSGQPREANAEGGVAPAIFGTVMMTLLMSLAVVPLGVLAALYLHEYAPPLAGLVSLVRIAVNNLAGVPSIVFGVFGLGFFCYVVGGTIDRVWFPERLPTPTFGGGAILWASLTLALLTVPVVIVATEEALAAVPDGLRAASLACGATQFQTICRVVLPSALPGIITGAILAMARGAGEVAPLMITGVVKLAPNLPLDHTAPFLHLERKFMHLGFHIYDLGFQSPNIEASKPMVYMTALLLLAIVVCLNLAAIRIRGRLRERFHGVEV